MSRKWFSYAHEITSEISLCCLSFIITRCEAAWDAPDIDSRTQHILSWRFGLESLSLTILSVLLIQEEQLTVNGESM